MVIISHEMSAIRSICARVAVMDQGSIIEVQDVESLFLKPQHPVTRRFVLEQEGQDLELLLATLRQGTSPGTLLALSFGPESADNRDLKLDS